MSDVIIYQGAAIPFSFSRQNGQPLDVTSVMRTLADITTYAANTEKKYVPYEGQTIACLEDKMLYILELKNGVLVPKLSGGVKLIKRDDNVELTDDAALSALRSVKEIEDRAISRTKRDRAAEVIEFAKGLTAGSGKTTVSGDGKVTTLNLLVQVLAETYDLNVSHVATMMRTIIKDYVSSEAFTPGLMGEGFKISKALNGDWNLEIDNVVVRKVMTIFEMVISKVRSVNGGLVISPANGRIKSVSETTGSPVYYVLGIEGDMQFVVDDYVRCQVFSNGYAKYYWVRVSSISGNSILVLKSEFTNGAVPAVGDDLVQMGNATNKARQGLIYLTASEDGKPRISVMDGVNSTSTIGKNKVILGCLDGITDTDFPADFQPSGYGLYAMNVFLKGIFVLRNGKSVEGEIEAAQNAASVAQAKADTVTRLFQEFTVAGGLFESKITEVKEYADGKVNALQIGGRNLVIGSTETDRLPKYGVTATVSKLPDNNNISKYKTVFSNIVRTAGDYVFFIPYGNNPDIFSQSMTGVESMISFFVRTNSPQEIFSERMASVKISIDSNWRKVTFPYTHNGSGNLHFFLSGADLQWMEIHSFKIEKGNKATDWTPAPEDVTADAQAKANAAQAAAEAVAIAKATLAKTEASAYADGIVTAEEQRAIADAKAKLAEAKTDAQTKADAAKAAAISDAASKYPTKSEVTSSINQKADEINLSVTEKINGVQVGGTNLLKNSSNWRAAGWNGGIASNGGGYTIDNTVLYHGNPTLKTDVGSGLLHSWLKLDAGIEYTYSAMVLCESYIPNSSVAPLYYHAGKDNTQQSKINVTKFDTELTPGIWKLIHIVFKLTGDADSFRPFLYRGANSGTFFWVAYMKLERGNKPTDWTPAPEDVQFQITENKAQIQVLSDQIALKVSNDTFNALGNRVSAAEATLTVHANQIASKVSQSDFNTLGQRVGSAESAITQQATQISSKVSTTEFDKLGVRVDSAESEIKQQASQIGLMVKKDDLTITGIDITNRKIVLTADSTVFKNNAGQQIAMFENNKLKVDLIDARAIVTGALVAEVISATNITTGKLTVTDNAKIGEFLVQNNSLVNYDFRASLQIGDSESLRYVKIGGDSLNLVRIQVAGDDAIGLNITTHRPTIGRFRENFAIRSVGSHRFKQRDADDIWDAPGVLWAGRVNAWGTLENSWGNACAASTRRTSDGKYTITHGLGHNQYYAIVQCTPYATDGWRYMIGMIEGKSLNSFDIALVDAGQGLRNCAFEVFIVGRNKF